MKNRTSHFLGLILAALAILPGSPAEAAGVGVGTGVGIGAGGDPPDPTITPSHTMTPTLTPTPVNTPPAALFQYPGWPSSPDGDAYRTRRERW